MSSTNTKGYYERFAARAAQGKVGWNKTPIFVTAGADRTDPMNGAGQRVGDSWWLHAEPDFLREQGERFARSSSGTPKRSTRKYGRDGVEEENRSFYPEKEAAADDAYEYQDYMPDNSEDIFSWWAGLHTVVEQSPEREAAFEKIKRYVHSFAPGTRGEDLDETKLRDLLTDLCGARGGLLTRREN